MSSSLPPLMDKGDRLVWSANEKASLFSVQFDAQQCCDRFQQLHSCDSSTVLCSVASSLALFVVCL